MRVSTYNIRTALKQINFFNLGRHSLVQSSRQKYWLLLTQHKTDHIKTLLEKITILVDRQAAIMAIQNNIERSSAVSTINCIKNLNSLDESNHVTITWTPRHLW